MTSLPRDIAGHDIRRYGFHGLSYEFIVDEIWRKHGAAAMNERMIVAHLGNGASMAAIQGGRSVETTMGFSTLARLPMGTRCGDIDPGIFLYLMVEKDLSAETIQHLLYERSGLLGISETSADMQELLSHSDRPQVAEANSYFSARARSYMGSLAAILGGIDRLVFTGGIGANAPKIRARICEGLGFLGIDRDLVRNRRGEQTISAAKSRVHIHAMPTDKELVVARHTVALASSRAIRREHER